MSSTSSGDAQFHKRHTMPGVALANLPSEARTSAHHPTRIGPYKIEGALGRGGMSILFLGVHSRTGFPAAIKVLSPEFVSHPQLREQFLREAQIIAMTDHPNIVKLFDQGEWENGVFLAMELLSGVSLRQFILQKSLSLRRSLEILLEMAYALLHLHSHNVIHRDLKPENVLITEEGTVKVVDFGIAQLGEKPSYLPGGLIGTPGYMSPEQKLSPEKASFSSDIYSWGVIAYELIVGELSQGVIHLALLPQGLRPIIESCLAVDPKERYQDIVDLISDLTTYIESSSWLQDRPENDLTKELLESLQKCQQRLLPIPLPRWEKIEMGFWRSSSLGEWGLYLDLFKLGRGCSAILTAQAKETSVEALFDLTELKGAIHTWMQYRFAPPAEGFDLIELMQALHAALMRKGAPPSLAVSCLLLDPLRDELSLIASGHYQLFHLGKGRSAPRTLEMEGPQLTDPMASGWQILRNPWEIGDTLLLHSFQRHDSEEQLAAALISGAFVETQALSPQRQVESIARRLTPATMRSNQSKMLLSLQRFA